MFGFFKNIKAEIASLKTRFEALEAKIESFFSDKKAAAPVEAQPAAAPVADETPKAE